ncbi:MAG: NAD-dependent epimerase/dehydratase family protein [Solirubrobacterales bacterium]
MRVAITGASGQVGTLLGQRLAAAGVEVTPLGRDEDWAAAIAGADAVAALAGTLQPARGESYRSANVETAAAVAAAARDGAVGRLAFLSYVGAAPDSANEYLRAKAEAEDLLVGSGAPTTIFRCLHIYGPPSRPGPTAAAFLVRGEGRVVVPGSGGQRIAPLYLGDVVAALFGALTAAEPASGRFELGGPEEMAIDEFVRALNGGEARIRHLPGPVARLAARLSPALTPALIDLLLRDNVVAEDPAEIGSRFGFEPHRLADVWPGRASRA